MSEAIKVTHDKERHRFVAVVEGKEALLQYSVSPDGKTLNYYHTFTPPELRGRGLASIITREALKYARDNGFTVIPGCPFVKAYMEKEEASS